MKRAGIVVAWSLCAVALNGIAADVSGRKMVWAHYVPWYTPDNASQIAHRFHSYPQTEVGGNPFRAEIERAMARNSTVKKKNSTVIP